MLSFVVETDKNQARFWESKSGSVSASFYTHTGSAYDCSRLTQF